jgi:hypothetical protein
VRPIAQTLFVKATLVSKCPSAWHLAENRFALLALLYYNSHAKNLVAFLKPEAMARAGVSPQRPGCSDYARRFKLWRVFFMVEAPEISVAQGSP